MSTLNSVHPRDVFEYSYFGNSLTIFQRDGGEIILGGYVSSDKHRDLVAEITPALNQGETTSFLFEAHTISQHATAQGTGALYTEAVLNVEGDDIFSIQVSDGMNSYKMESTTVDISNKKSVENFIQTLEETLATSEIKVSMDLDGNINFKRIDGGEIILQEFTSATGRHGSWKPSPGQGDTISLSGTGIVDVMKSYTSNTTSTGPIESKEPALSYIPIEGADTPISNLSIETESDSQSAIGVIDLALDYVAAERSNLGAIQNRLTHTIDNLTNIVTNTEASQSKILDADYAKETTELTRTQIIQQAATAMLAQANQSAQTVLELLR